MNNSYYVVEKIPTLEAYRMLCEAVGWGDIVNFEVAEMALANSLYSLVALCQDKVIGIGAHCWRWGHSPIPVNENILGG